MLGKPWPGLAVVVVFVARRKADACELLRFFRHPFRARLAVVVVELEFLAPLGFQRAAAGVSFDRDLLPPPPPLA